MRTRSLMTVTLLSVASVMGVAAAQERLTHEELARRAAVIKPSSAELKWQQVPWVRDSAEGQRLARAEKRPICLWVTDGDPLERC